MERLTVRRKGGRWAIANNDGASPMEQMEKFPIAINRLAAYEDTGLEPGEITELKRGWKAVCKLHRINAPPPNDPLTLDELREMDGEPVWVECLGNKDDSVWAVVDFCLDGIHTRYFYADFNYYGDEWLAYRRKPEEGTR